MGTKPWEPGSCKPSSLAGRWSSPSCTGTWHHSKALLRHILSFLFVVSFRGDRPLTSSLAVCSVKLVMLWTVRGTEVERTKQSPTGPASRSSWLWEYISSGGPGAAPPPLKFFRTLIVKAHGFLPLFFFLIIKEYFTYNKIHKSWVFWLLVIDTPL